MKMKELKGVVYAFTCGQCDKSYIGNQSTLDQVIDQNCMECFVKMKLEFKNHMLKEVVDEESKEEGQNQKGSKGKKKK